MSNDDDEEVRNNHYATPKAPSFELQLSTGTVQAVNGVMKLTDAENKELKKLLRSGRPDIAQNLVELDYEAAEKTAKEFLASKTATASRGGISTANNAEAGANRGPASEASVNIDDAAAGNSLKPAPDVGGEVKDAKAHTPSLAEKLRARQTQNKPIEENVSHGDDVK